MKKILIIGGIVVVIAVGIFLFLSLSQPKIPVAAIITPDPNASPAAPTLAPTPEVEILEYEDEESLLLLEFHSLLDIMTMSQYNYTMISTRDLFSAMYQSNVRNYSFTQFKAINEGLIASRFSFSNDDELLIPFNSFVDTFVDSDQEYLLILDMESIESAAINYKYTANLYINMEQVASFNFLVNKKTLQIKFR